jgi:hypothetical protein
VQGVDRDIAAGILDALCTEDEMNTALQRLKCGKAGDVYGLRAEYLLLCTRTRVGDTVKVKYTLSEHLAHAFNTCLTSGLAPDLLTWGKGCPLHKAGDPAVHDNYRVITIGPVLAKVFSFVMHARADRYLEQQRLRVPEQCGFRRQRSCADQLFVLQHLVGKYQAPSQKLHALFVDFRKAFDSVPRDFMFQRLRQLGFSPRYLGMLESMYDTARVSFCVAGTTSDAVPTSAGVLQGDPLSPTLFGVYIDCVIHHLRRIMSNLAQRPNNGGGGWTPQVPQVGGQDIHGLLYADDLVLLSLDARTAQLQLNALSAFCQAYGLQVNLRKCAAVVFRGKGRRVDVPLKYRGELWPQVETYTYLGLELGGTQGVLQGVKALVRAGRRAAMAALSRCRQLHIDDLDTAMRLFNNQVLPCLLYGAEVWLPFVMRQHRGGMLANPTQAVKHCLEKVQLLFIKRVLRLRQNTTSWVVLAEAGRLPVFMYGLRRVCRYWNKLASADAQHLARAALLESVEGNAAAWAPIVASVCPQLGITLHRPDPAEPDESEDGDTTVHSQVDGEVVLPAPVPELADAHVPELAHVPEPTDAAPVTVLVFDLEEVQMACSHQLEEWWQGWQQPDSTDSTSQLRQYALLFKHWRHLDANEHYLFAAGMPKQLQYLLLRLRAFNLTLAAHVYKWGGRGERAGGPACGMCGEPETEQHLLFECPAYTDMRSRYAIGVHSQAHIFTSEGAYNTARYVRAVLRMRENHIADEVMQYAMFDSTASWGLPSQARLGVAVLLMIGISLIVVTLIWALDAYRV